MRQLRPDTAKRNSTIGSPASAVVLGSDTPLGPLTQAAGNPQRLWDGLRRRTWRVSLRLRAFVLSPLAFSDPRICNSRTGLTLRARFGGLISRGGVLQNDVLDTWSATVTHTCQTPVPLRLLYVDLGFRARAGVWLVRLVCGAGFM